MPIQVNSSTAQSAGAEGASLFTKASRMVGEKVGSLSTAASKLAGQLKLCMPNIFHKLVACGSKSSSGGEILRARLAEIAQTIRPNGANSNALRKIDSSEPVTKRITALRAESHLKGLEKLAARLPWSKYGTINQSYIEHFCGLRKAADHAVPNYDPSTSEGSTQQLMHLHDSTQGIIHSEMSIIESILNDMNAVEDPNMVDPKVKSGLEKALSTLKNTQDLMSKISRHAIFDVGESDPFAMAKAAKGLMDSVDKAKVGEQLIIPLVFHCCRQGGADYNGHATYLLVEKTTEQTVNMHMINRGLGSNQHARLSTKQDNLHEMGIQRPPKAESAFSKWGVKLNQPSGLDFSFMLNTLRLTQDGRDSKFAPDFRPEYSDNSLKQLSKNIRDFYSSFKKLSGGPAPEGHKPIYQRPQKDGNCMYSNLKAAVRHLLNDEKTYNKIDLFKTEKVSVLSMSYLKNALLSNTGLRTDKLNRMAFDGEQAAQKIIAKHREAEQRVFDDYKS
ncbi:hypothetical protein [Limnobacter sp.]|uniref:hypothetical protein n=1 Tax=Limnobacter sp. TaxID=2003368 RepID=UPI003519B123